MCPQKGVKYSQNPCADSKPSRTPKSSSLLDLQPKYNLDNNLAARVGSNPALSAYGKRPLTGPFFVGGEGGMRTRLSRSESTRVRRREAAPRAWAQPTRSASPPGGRREREMRNGASTKHTRSQRTEPAVGRAASMSGFDTRRAPRPRAEPTRTESSSGDAGGVKCASVQSSNDARKLNSRVTPRELNEIPGTYRRTFNSSSH